MRLYIMEAQRDLTDTIGRCYYDAEHGNAKLALDRLADLDDQLGPDARIAYAEGMIRIEFIGQGVAAHACFLRALEIDPKHAFAACNAVEYAPDEAAFRRWAPVASRLSPEDAEKLATGIEILDTGTPRWQSLLGSAAHTGSEPGREAALIEIALLEARMRPDEEVEVRRRRAGLLRELDRRAAESHETAMVAFLPDEHLALIEAVAEVDRALEIDDDAELWNSRSAWCFLMRQPDEAIRCADRALALRPEGYLQPLQNKAVALAAVDRVDEAKACLRDAIKQAETGGHDDELPKLTRILREIEEAGDATATLPEVLPILNQAVKAALVTGNTFLGTVGTTAEPMAGALINNFRMGGAVPGQPITYVGMMARALVDLPAESCFLVLTRVQAQNESAFESAMRSLLFIVANAEPVMRRDAARVLLLMLVMASAAPDGARAVRDFYRVTILAATAAATGPLRQLDRLMREEMDRMKLVLAGLVADQEPLSTAEIERARVGVASGLEGPLTVRTVRTDGMPLSPGMPHAPGRPAAPNGGCAPALVTVLAIGAVITTKALG